MRIKFLTLNILHGGVFAERLIPFLNQENADIVTLQEAQDSSSSNLLWHYHTIKNLKETFPLYNVFFEPQVLIEDRGVEIEHGNAVFSKFPLHKVAAEFFDTKYRRVVYREMKKSNNFSTMPINMQHVEINSGDINLNVFNIHGIWGTDGKDNERRLKMSQIITDKIKNKEHVILAGDFNVRPDTQTIANIEKHLRNVFKGELKTTFNMRRKLSNGYSNAVVDMIFVSPDIKVLDHYCPQVDISDHLPLICTLEIN